MFTGIIQFSGIIEALEKLDAGALVAAPHHFS